jgi:hypothetical protein
MDKKQIKHIPNTIYLSKKDTVVPDPTNLLKPNPTKSLSFKIAFQKGECFAE